jgi:hypothetical protein
MTSLGERIVLAACLEEMRLRGFIAAEGLEQRFTGYFDVEDQLAIMSEVIRPGGQPHSAWDAILWMLPLQIITDPRGLKLAREQHLDH